MYRHQAFRVHDDARAYDLVTQVGLVHLVVDDGDTLRSSPLPVLADRAKGMLLFHVARANPISQVAPGSSALVLATGPHAYVSPRDYPPDYGTKVVPTWDYLSVEFAGRVQVVHDPEELLGLVTSLTEHHEQSLTAPWSVTEADPSYLTALLGAITGIVVEVAQIDLTMKLSQNRAPQVRHHLATSLEERGETALAQHMAAWR